MGSQLCHTVHSRVAARRFHDTAMPSRPRCLANPRSPRRVPNFVWVSTYSPRSSAQRLYSAKGLSPVPRPSSQDAPLLNELAEHVHIVAVVVGRCRSLHPVPISPFRCQSMQPATAQRRMAGHSARNLLVSCLSCSASGIVTVNGTSRIRRHIPWSVPRIVGL